MKKAWATFKRGWMAFAHKMGWFNEHVLLGIVFFLVIGVYAFPAKIFRMLQSKPLSLWRDFEHHPKTVEDLKHPF